MLKGCRLLIAVSIVFGVLFYSSLLKSSARPDGEPRIISLGPSGDYSEAPDRLVVATRLYNRSKTATLRIDIDSIRLESAALLSPTTFPQPVIELAPEKFATIQADFNSSHLIQGQEYRLEVHGTYRTQDKDQRDDKSSNDDRHEFRVSDEIKLPPVSPGSAQLKSSKVESQHVSGGHYPYTAPNFDEE